MSTGYGYDAKRGLLVCVRDERESDAEYAGFLERTEALDRAASEAGIEPVFIAVLKPKTPAPNAAWRRKFAESSSRSTSARSFVGIVTVSAVMRGVINAIGWLQTRSGHRATAFSTFEAACAGAAKFRGAPIPELPKLLAVARADLENHRIDARV